MPELERPAEGYGARVVIAWASCRRQAAVTVFRRLCHWGRQSFRLLSPRVVIRGEFNTNPLFFRNLPY